MNVRWVLAVVAILAVSCGTTTVNQSPRQFNELMGRPDIGQAVARYQEMYAAVRQITGCHLTAAAKLRGWASGALVEPVLF
jgi:hypothetical protein